MYVSYSRVATFRKYSLLANFTVFDKIRCFSPKNFAYFHDEQISASHDQSIGMEWRLDIFLITNRYDEILSIN